MDGSKPNIVTPIINLQGKILSEGKPFIQWLFLGMIQDFVASR